MNKNELTMLYLSGYLFRKKECGHYCGTDLFYLKENVGKGEVLFPERCCICVIDGVYAPFIEKIYCKICEDEKHG